MLLRYTGPGPVLFTSIGVEVDTGTEFEVPDEDAAGFTRRADVEQVAAPPRTRTRRTSPPGVMPIAPDPAGDSTTPAGPVPDPTEAP